MRLVFILVSVAAALNGTIRKCAGDPLIAFDEGWRFVQGDPAGAESPQFDDTKWTSVDLPHDWSIFGPIAADNPAGSPGGFFPTGIGWYRKAFEAPQGWSGKRVAIQFEGVYMLSDVWINGHKLGTHTYGFTPFAYDLTTYLNIGGNNVVSVRVDNSRPLNCRWYSGSGIYRHVRLDVGEPIHITQFGVFVRTVEVSGGTARLGISITAENDGNEIDPRVEYATQVFEAAGDGRRVGSAVASFVPVGAGFPIIDGVRQRTMTVQTTATLPSPQPWSPQTPNLYVAVTTASINGRVVDTRETTFGVRTIAVSVDKGFVLNGHAVKLYGACVHDDNGPLGAAAFDRAEVRRVELLKAAGFNAVRCAIIHRRPPSWMHAIVWA